MDEDSQDTAVVASSSNGDDVEEEVQEKKVKVLVDGKKRQKTPGVVYLSSIPTKMNVRLIRDYFGEYGAVDRIFLQPEEKKGKKKKKGIRMFSEGWVEFKDKKIAKLVAKKLNRHAVGGRKRNPWFEELWNIKYLKGFRWTHLNERMAYENESRKQRLRQEVSLAKKEANFYVQNYEKSERRKRLDKKNKPQNSENTAENDDSKMQSTNNVDNSKEAESPTDNFTNKRPKFDRKVKVANNDTFLKLVFAK